MNPVFFYSLMNRSRACARELYCFIKGYHLNTVGAYQGRTLSHDIREILIISTSCCSMVVVVRRLLLFIASLPEFLSVAVIASLAYNQPGFKALEPASLTSGETTVVPARKSLKKSDKNLIGPKLSGLLVLKAARCELD